MLLERHSGMWTAWYIYESRIEPSSLMKGWRVQLYKYWIPPKLQIIGQFNFKTNVHHTIPNLWEHTNVKPSDCWTELYWYSTQLGNQEDQFLQALHITNQFVQLEVSETGHGVQFLNIKWQIENIWKCFFYLHKLAMWFNKPCFCCQNWRRCLFLMKWWWQCIK